METQKNSLAVLREVADAAEVEASGVLEEVASARATSADIEVVREQRYGFAVPLQTQAQVALTKQERLSQQRDGRKAFDAQLTRAGIPPAAVLPKKLWSAFTKKFHLVRFESLTREGAAPTNLASVADAGTMLLLLLSFCVAPIVSIVLFGVPWLSLVYAVSTYTLFFTFNSFADKVPRPKLGFTLAVVTLLLLFGAPVIERGAYPLAITYVTLFVGWVVQFVVLMLFLSILVSNPIKNLVTEVCAFTLRIAPARVRCKALWPQGSDAPHAKDGSTVKILFPTPPADFAAMLGNIEQAGYKPCIAAAPAAVEVNPSSLKQAVRQALDRDPICYVLSPDGQYVAVFSQFGSFPDEKKVMRWAIEEGKRVFLKD